MTKISGPQKAALLVAALALSATAARAATPINFTVRTAGDLVALCETPSNDITYTAAIHFCQGFATGAFQYYEASVRADPGQRFVCPPTPPPTRNQAVAGFLAWAKANSSAMTGPAADALFRYLGETYPCNTPAKKSP